MTQVILYIDKEDEKVLLELKEDWEMSKVDALQTIVADFLKNYKKKKSQKVIKEEEIEEKGETEEEPDIIDTLEEINENGI